ncbi:MAG: hypothetical protein M3Z01_09875 [Thermoproteota archaeon]|nr:hypothetical protein [Thermoproteota archaeon]
MNFSTTLLLLILFIFSIMTTNNNFIIFSQSESISGQMSKDQMGGGIGGKIISSLTEWIGIFAIGMTTGLLALKINNPNNVTTLVRMRRIIISIAILSLATGTIHILLVQEHGKESFWWGIFFLISGIAQMIFGILIVFVKTIPANNVLYYTGIIGNVLLFGVFILVRLFTPPFSSEGTPINELEPNGIITLIDEMVIAILLLYIIKFKEAPKKIIR